jgi:hypothetical protein
MLQLVDKCALRLEWTMRQNKIFVNDVMYKFIKCFNKIQ